MREWFTKLARRVSDAAGHPYAFLAGLVLIVGWALCGPLLSYSDSWQLYANTFTTLVTFLMVFLIQASQNRSERVIQTKLDELLRSMAEADNRLINLESDTDEALEAARQSIVAGKNC
jgi:low affinity Fe/Cu permease